MSIVRCLYLDLDGTLLGRGASLLHDGEGAVTIDGVRAVQACLRADVEVVLMSGRRRRAQVLEDARLLGQASFIYEAGACLMLDGEEHWLTGELLPGRAVDRRADRALGRARAAARALRGAARVPRAVARAARGLASVPRAGGRRRGRRRCSRSTATSDLRLVDNGVVSRRSPALAQLPHVRGYHLVPAGRSKAAAVALHIAGARLRARGDVRGRRLARGPRVRRSSGRVLAGRQRARARPHDARALAAHANVRVTEAGHGPGVYEAVVSTLMGAG